MYTSLLSFHHHVSIAPVKPTVFINTTTQQMWLHPNTSKINIILEPTKVKWITRKQSVGQVGRWCVKIVNHNTNKSGKGGCNELAVAEENECHWKICQHIPLLGWSSFSAVSDISFWIISCRKSRLWTTNKICYILVTKYKIHLVKIVGYCGFLQ